MADEPLPETMRVPTSAVIPHAKLTQYLLAYRRRSDKNAVSGTGGVHSGQPCRSRPWSTGPARALRGALPGSAGVDTSGSSWSRANAHGALAEEWSCL